MAKNLQAYKLGVTITADAARALAALRSVDSQATKTQGSLGGVSKSASGMFSGLSGAASVAAGNLLTGVITKVAGAMSSATQEGIAYNRQIETFNIAIERQIGDVLRAQKHLSDLEKIAFKTPFELPGIVSASLKLQGFGFEAERVIKDFPAISDAAAMAAASTGDFEESIKGVTLAIGQMKAKGKVSLEEINQLTERGIPALDILARKIGKTNAETSKLIASGRADGEVGVQLLIEGFGERYAGLGDKLSQTLAGKESNALDVLRKQAGNAARETTEAYKRALDQTISGAQSATVSNFAKEYDRRLAADADFITDVVGGKVSAKEIGAALIPTAKDTAAELGTALKYGLAGAWKAAGEFASGIAAGVGQQMGTSAEQGAKQKLEIKSPSGVFRRIGSQTAEGFAVGFEEYLDDKGGARVESAIQRMVNRQLAKLGDLDKFKAVAEKLGIPVSVLLGIGSRETNLKNIIGDGGRGVGIMQVDTGTDAAFKASGAWKDVGKSVERGAEILLDKMRQLQRMAGKEMSLKDRSGRSYSFTVPTLEGADLLETALASYNSGMWAAYHKSKGRRADYGTTGGDYAADVLERSRAFKAALEGGAQTAAPTKAAPRSNVLPFRQPTRQQPMPVMIVAGGNVDAGTTRAGETPLALSDIKPEQLGGLVNNVLPFALKRPGLFDEPAGTTTEAQPAASSTQENYDRLMGGSGNAGRSSLFGDATLDVGAFGANGGDLAAQASGIEKAMAGLRAAGEEIKGLAKGAFADFAQGLGGIVEQFVLTGETGPGAMKKLAAGVLASLAAQAAVKSLFYLAEGIAAATNPFTAYMAPGYFTASAVMAGIAGGAALAGRAVAGKGNKGQITDEQRREAARRDQTSESYAGNQYERRAGGGRVLRGRSYLVGENRPEVVTFDNDGYVSPSVNDYRRRTINDLRDFQSRNGNGFGIIEKMIRKLEEHFARLEAVNGEDVFIRFTENNPRAIGRAAVEAVNSDDQLSARLGRRIAA